MLVRQACVDEGYVPILNIPRKKLDRLLILVDDKVVRKAFIVIEKVLLDHFSFPSQTKDKIRVAKVSVVLHHVPKDRAISYVDKRLGY
jgi:hypothetical protein